MKVFCYDCGSELKQHTTPYPEDGQVTVHPCEKCCEATRQQALGDGRKDGMKEAAQLIKDNL